jgi:hypothetical protein
MAGIMEEKGMKVGRARGFNESRKGEAKQSDGHVGVSNLRYFNE